MALTPEEIERHTFRERFRGYDPDEVDAFLDRVVGALRALEQERDAAQRERDDAIAQRDQAQAGAGESEALLRKTLVSAQRTAEQTVGEANADAERIRRRAQDQSSRVLGEARARAHEVADAVDELVAAHERLLASLRAVLAEHGELVERGGQLPPAADLAARLRAIADEPTEADEPPADGAIADELDDEEVAPAGELSDGDGPEPTRSEPPPTSEPPGFYPPPPR